MSSPLRSPARKPESAEAAETYKTPPSSPSLGPTRARIAASPPLSPLRLPPPPEKTPRPPALEPIDDSVASASPLRSPLRPLAPVASPRTAPAKPGSSAQPAIVEPTEEVVYAVTMANRLTRDDGSAGGGSARREESRALRAVPATLRRAELRRAELGLRVSAAVLCLVSFSVMASDKTRGWAGDAFERYEEFRYSLGVNVIAFVYSVYQVGAETHRVVTGRRIIRRPWAYYFDLALDQILAYLLMSSASAAASRNDVWVSRFNADDFTRKINGSVAMSFLAFIALAISAVISTYNLFSRLS